MLNKKMLAAAIAASISANAFATVDIEADTGAVVYATELYSAVDVDSDGNLSVANAGNILDVTFQAGFTIAGSTSKYFRVELENATFDAVPTLTGGAAGFSATVSQGGNGESFVIFEVTATADIASTDVLTLAASDYLVSATAASSVSIAHYETAGDAVTESGALYTESGSFTSTASGSTGEFAVAETTTATVATNFTNFDGDAISATRALVGSIDADLVLDGTTYLLDGTPAASTDFLTTSQEVTITGDFSFGTWTIENANTCGGGAAIVDTPTVAGDDASVTTSAAIDVTTADLFLCVNVDGTETINKSSYTASLDTDSLEDGIGTIKYDTTSIEVPFLTTFADYNQRFYLTNYSSSAVAYSISFISEDGVTVTDGSAVSGTIPADETLMIKATDIATITGKTRTQAIIEVEAVDADVSAATQIVNLSDAAKGTTDTIVLN